MKTGLTKIRVEHVEMESGGVAGWTLVVIDNDNTPEAPDVQVVTTDDLEMLRSALMIAIGTAAFRDRRISYEQHCDQCQTIVDHEVRHVTAQFN